MKRFIKWTLISGVVGVLLLLGVNQTVIQSSESLIYTEIDALPEKQTVIVLGAFVRGDNLSLVLKDRMDSGLAIYNAHKASKMLLTGDHGRVEYDEVNAMRKYALRSEAGPSRSDVFTDHAGFDTYDSLYRAKEIFGVESAVIVTQDFHINRAVYIAKSLGIDAVGYAVNEEKYIQPLRFKWHVREILSRVKAYVDVSSSSEPTYLGEKIPITGDGTSSWDEDL